MGTLKLKSAHSKRLTLRDFLDSQAHAGNAPGRFARNLEIVSHFLRCCKPGSTVPVGNKELDLCVKAMDDLNTDLVDAANEFYVWRHGIQFDEYAACRSDADDQF